MRVTPSTYDLRDLIDMLAERRSRAEKERILWAIRTLRRDDEADAKEMAHLMGADCAAAGAPEVG